MDAIRAMLASLAAVLAAAPPAAAQDRPDLSSVTFLTGACERMMVAGQDASATCRGPVSNVVYNTGRISFAFPNDAGVLVSFSGTDQLTDGDRVLLRLDRITTAVEESPTATTEDGIGTCEFGDFLAGPVRIQCAGRTESGDYIGIFTTDGKPPSVERF